MADLFGIDIAGIVNDAIVGAGGLRQSTLLKTVSGTRTAGALTSGNNPTQTVHACQAFHEASKERVDDSLAETRGEFVSILGASIDPAAEPSTGDVIVVDGVRYDIVDIPEVDPARALYRCRVET